MKKFLIFFVLFKIITPFQYTYIRENSNDPLGKIPICIGENIEGIKCSEIPIDLAYSYLLISPNFYSIKDLKGTDYCQEFINYHYYFLKGIKSETNFFLKKSNSFIKGNNTKLNFISGFQDTNKLGLGAYLEEQGESNDIFEYNFINYLFKNNFIEDLTFSFEPKSKIETSITIGEKINKDYKKCYSSNKLEEKNLWNCPLNKITIDNSDIQFLKGENNYVIFDSLSEDIQIPYDTGMEILNYINEKTGNKCYFEENKFCGPKQQEFSYTYLICKLGVDISKVPDIKFIFDNFELYLGKNDLLRPYDCFRNRVNILAYKNLKYIKISIPILNKYSIVFDYKDNSIGIIQDKSYIFEEIKKNNINFYIVIIFILIIFIISFSFRKRLKEKKNSHLIDYNNFSNEVVE